MKRICHFMAALLLLNATACDEHTKNSPSSTDNIQLVEIEEAKPLDQPSAVPGKDALKEDSTFNTEDYSNIVENKFLAPLQNPLSTFSIDVDEASYANVRRIIQDGSLPPAGAVRIEEMINYFDYKYPQPGNNEPFSVTTELSECPWNTMHRLIHIGLQGKEIPIQNLPAANLVFLIDVSGSMNDANKLPLVKTSLKMLTGQLRDIDAVAIVVYAGSAGLVLPSTSGTNKMKIREAIDNLEAGGSTAGGEGIQLAYKVASENFVKGGNNRVILATDGDFNIGPSSDDDMVSLIEKERVSGIYLSVLGFGIGNYKDNKMQLLADKGNGNHSYIDNINEARKVLVTEFGSTLFAIAKDVKIQVEFNPEKVQAYRLIGYENRVMAAEDFNDDQKDAGELGSGHTVTALYEIIPVGIANEFASKVDSLKYQSGRSATAHSFSKEIMTIKLFTINGLLYVLFTIFSGQWRYLLPDKHSFREAWQVMLHDLGIRKKAPSHIKYNGAQKIAYTGIVIMGLGSVLTGLAIYKPVQLGWLCSMMGGYESARVIHFILTIGYCLFFIVHILQVIRAGWNNFRGIITGFEVVSLVPPEVLSEAPPEVVSTVPPEVVSTVPPKDEIQHSEIDII